MTKNGWLLVCWGLLFLPCAVAQTAPPTLSSPSSRVSPVTTTPSTSRLQPTTLQPTYWKQRLFFIPYQLNPNGQLPHSQSRSPIAKVQLLYARTIANDWKVLQQAEPNVRGFSYHAPEDGEYWFTLRHLDRRGQPWPNAEVRPQMRIVIDTVPPELKLAVTLDITGQAVIRYEARDANLNAKSLVVEVREQGNRWTPLPIGTPDISYPNQLVGRIYWRPPTGMQKVEVRAVIADQTNRRTQATTTSSPATNAGALNAGASTSVAADGPALGSPLEKTVAPVLRSPFQRPSVQRPSVQRPPVQRPMIAGPKTSSVAKNPFAAPPFAVSPAASPARTSPARTSSARLPARNWPANNRLPSTIQSATQPSAQINPHRTPPQANPYSVTGLARPNRMPAALIGDGQKKVASNNLNSGAGQPQTLSVTPLGIGNAPPLTDFNRRQPSLQSNQWSAARGLANRLADRVVNSRTFDIDYDLQSVGPWGVSKVELWGTHDNGRTWQSYATDADNRSPIRVTVSTAGTFGFRILVDGANSVGSAPPQPGDEPELTITVDLQPPIAKLLSAALGAGNLAGHLQVEWTASDTNLESRPIALFYSSYPNGPWSTIATGLENTGNYTWRIERHIPARFYLRLEVRDIAGNLATHQNPSPIELTRPQPKGRLRGVRSISESVRP